MKVYVPTDEMYDLTEQAYSYSSTLYDIYGASDQFEKKADSFFKVRSNIKNYKDLRVIAIYHIERSPPLQYFWHGILFWKSQAKIPSNL